jgi:hypothetical protein
VCREKSFFAAQYFAQAARENGGTRENSHLYLLSLSIYSTIPKTAPARQLRAARGEIILAQNWASQGSSARNL